LHIHVSLPSRPPHPPPLWIEWRLYPHTDKGMFAKLECFSVSLFLLWNERTLVTKDSRPDWYPVFVLYQFVF